MCSFPGSFSYPPSLAISLTLALALSMRASLPCKSCKGCKGSLESWPSSDLPRAAPAVTAHHDDYSSGVERRRCRRTSFMCRVWCEASNFIRRGIWPAGQTARCLHGAFHIRAVMGWASSSRRGNGSRSRSRSEGCEIDALPHARGASYSARRPQCAAARDFEHAGCLPGLPGLPAKRKFQGSMIAPWCVCSVIRDPYRGGSASTLSLSAFLNQITPQHHPTSNIRHRGHGPLTTDH